MRKVIIFFLILESVFCAKVQITAKKFLADELKAKVEFLGDVVITKQKDILKADKLIVNFDKNKKPKLYTATGHATLLMFLKNKQYFAKGDKLIYEPRLDQYYIKGNAFLEDRSTNKKVFGQNISVNQNSGQYEVNGKKDEPVKFIFEVDEKQVGKN